MIDINGFIKWQLEGRRSVDIRIGNSVNNEIKIWCWDYDLQTGQHVSTPEEIDLIAVKKRQLQAKIAELEKLEKNSIDSISQEEANENNQQA